MVVQELEVKVQELMSIQVKICYAMDNHRANSGARRTETTTADNAVVRSVRSLLEVFPEWTSGGWGAGDSKLTQVTPTVRTPNGMSNFNFKKKM